VQYPALHFRPKLFVLCSLFLISISLSALACKKNARVAVTQENLAKSNALLQYGDAAFNRRDFYAALIKYLEASHLNPNDELMWNRLGIAYSQLKYYDEGIAAFRRSIQLNSKYANSINNLGSAFFARKEFKKAEKHFKKAIRMDGKEAIFHMNLGSLYFERKNISGALVEWRKGLSLNPDIFARSTAVSISIAGENSFPKDKAFVFARIYALAGNTSKSIEFLEQALKDGFSDLNAIQRQPDFDRIRNDEQFIKFIKDAPFWTSPKQ
jgi:tetratricopeptide (TPR) repeat protein